MKTARVPLAKAAQAASHAVPERREAGAPIGSAQAPRPGVSGDNPKPTPGLKERSAAPEAPAVAPVAINVPVENRQQPTDPKHQAAVSPAKPAIPAIISVPAAPHAPDHATEGQPAAAPKAAETKPAQAAAPATPAPVSAAASDAERYCSNVAASAADARLAWQAKKLTELDAQIKQRVAELEAKQAEYKNWLKKREEFQKKAEDGVVAIYAQMRPEAAASQLSAMEDNVAAAILSKLKARSASAILNEMDAAHAARLTDAMTGAQPKGDGNKS